MMLTLSTAKGMINSHFHMIGAMTAEMIFSNPTKDYRAFWLARGLEQTLMQLLLIMKDGGIYKNLLD